MKSVILLRGINVGGHGKLPMNELCEVLIGLGAQNPETYIQSGNVVIDGTIDGAALSDAIETTKGFRPSVMVIDGETFKKTAVQIPYDEPNGKLLHIWFALSAFTFDQDKADTLKATTESLFITPTAIYLHAPEGIGRSKLAAKIEALAGVPCTARNMNTVRKLLQMLDA